FTPGPWIAAVTVAIPPVSSTSAVTFTKPLAICALGFAERERICGGVRSVRVPVEKVQIESWPIAFPGSEASDDVAFTWTPYWVPTARLPPGRQGRCVAPVARVVVPPTRG